MKKPLVEIIRFWDRSTRLWIVTFHDRAGYQIGETEYFPNRARMNDARDRLAERLAEEIALSERCEAHTEGDGSWWEKDAQGIPLCRVCARCRPARLSAYRPEILFGYSQADIDEPIEPDA